MSLLEQASLVITPNAYKESKLYSVVPNTTLGDMDVVRATTATRVNSNGLIEEVPYNLVRYSEDISNSAWAKYNITMSANSTTAPNGTLTAEKLLSSNSTSFQGIEIQVNYISGQKYTNSIYFKYIDTPFVQIITPSFVSSNYVNFNIQTGEVVGGVYEDATVTSVGNGWYRCSFTFISNYTGSGGTIGSANLINSASSSKASDFTGNGVKGIYLWGAQLVTSTSAKEYFPTTDRLNIPRIDYTNGSCPSLLVEPQRTNLALYSEQFDNAYWTRNNVTVNANSVISPDGTQNAETITSSGTTSFLYTTTAALTGAYTLSFFAKKGTSNFCWVYLNGYDAIFNLNTGTFVSSVVAPESYSIIAYANGWYKISITKTSPILAALSGIGVASSTNFNGVVGTNIYVYGAQLEAGAYPTSYIPTVASSVTRNADVISKTGISSLIGQTEGTIFLDFYAKNNNTFQILSQLRNVSGTAQIDLRWADGGLYALGNNNGANQFYLSVGSISVGSRYKVAIAYKLNDVKIYMNGTNVNSDTAATFLDQSMSYFSFAENLSNYIEAQFINSAQLYKTRLTNTELAQLTTL